MALRVKKGQLREKNGRTVIEPAKRAPRSVSDKIGQEKQAKRKVGQWERIAPGRVAVAKIKQ